MSTNNNVVELRKIPNSIYADITNSTAKNFKPRANDTYIRDKKLSGFYIKVRPNGKQTYCVQARPFGIKKNKSKTIGDCNIFSAKDARALAIEYIQRIRTGKTLTPDLPETKEESIESLVNTYASVRELKARTIKDLKTELPRHMPVLSRMNLADITIDHVEKWWIEKAKIQATRKRVFSYARALTTYAQAKRVVPYNVFKSFNKVVGQIKAPDPIDRHIKVEDMPSWVASFVGLARPRESLRDKTKFTKTPQYIKTDDPFEYFNSEHQPIHYRSRITETQRDFILFLLVTGKRSGEASRLEWPDIDDVNSGDGEKLKTITIHKDETKNGKVDVIPMTMLTWHMLRYRYNHPNRHDKWVFPNKYGNNPISRVSKTNEKIIKSAHLSYGISPHDFRRTFATFLRSYGISEEDVAIHLNHTRTNVTAAYTRLSLEYKLNNLERLEQLILDHIRGWMMHYWYDGDEGWVSEPPEELKKKIYYHSHDYGPK
jgi:integrase